MMKNLTGKRLSDLFLKEKPAPTGGGPLDLLTLSKTSEALGTTKKSKLAEKQFNKENLGTWILADGRDARNSTYCMEKKVKRVPMLMKRITRNRNRDMGKILENVYIKIEY